MYAKPRSNSAYPASTGGRRNASALSARRPVRSARSCPDGIAGCSGALPGAIPARLSTAVIDDSPSRSPLGTRRRAIRLRVQERTATRRSRVHAPAASSATSSPRFASRSTQASTLPGAASHSGPICPTISADPPCAEAITGSPADIASTRVIGNTSKQTDGNTSAREPSMSSRTSSWGSHPANRTPSIARRSRSSRRGPSPTTSSSRSRGRARAHASSNTSTPFSSETRPTYNTVDELDGGRVRGPASATACGRTMKRSAGSPPATRVSRSPRDGAMNRSTAFTHVPRARLNESVAAAAADCSAESR